MRKQFFLSLIIVLAFSNVFQPIPSQAGVKAIVSSNTLMLDGKLAVMQWRDLTVICQAFDINNSTFIKLRDLASVLSNTLSRFDIVWNPSLSQIEIATGKTYNQKDASREFFRDHEVYLAEKTNLKVTIDGTQVSFEAYNIKGNSYFKLRDLASYLSLTIGWDQKTKSILIFSKPLENVHITITQSYFNDNQVSRFHMNHSDPKRSFIFTNNDNTISTFNVDKDNKIEITTYDENINEIASKIIGMDLPIFGTFHSDANNNYIVFGRENKEQNDKKEVIRIVKYDKQFNKISQTSVNGGESFTIVPFDFGCPRLSTNDKHLVLHTSRLRYKTEDGLNHQSQLTIVVDIKTMKKLNYLGRFQENHVSHSFDQYVLFDGENHVLLDHGDAYPRSVVVHKSIDPAGNAYQYSNVFNIPGTTGDNWTGVSVGGFEMSQTKYLVTMNTVNHKLTNLYSGDQRDILLCTIPKEKLESAYVNQTTIAKYVGTKKLSSIPKLVKANEKLFYILWQEFNNIGETGSLKYVRVDGNGKILGDVVSVDNFVLSDCQPIISNNFIFWITNFGKSRFFYRIPLTD